MLTEGTKAPDFMLQISEDRSIRLSDFLGKKVVLYFYPKDNTPGCTKEACSFRDNYSAITDKGAVVIGISPDSIASHNRFREKHDLPFFLGSDPDHKVAEAYGAWGEKTRFGKTSMGILRSTFVIDESGTIIKVFDKVNTETHGQDVLAFL
ncbi:MAG: thioredoxin-dependent thiol peroxidase [Firmicutes bacterium]|nr:thioredoxin-dependent thiol peroxidase [Bacillota bacterium]